MRLCGKYLPHKNRHDCIIIFFIHILFFISFNIQVPATREVLGSLPNVFSALCLNSRGLTSFVSFNPFERLFKVLLSPAYLSAMRRRRSSDPMGDTASNLGNAMDELMRHQPSLKTSATKAIIKVFVFLTCFHVLDIVTKPCYLIENLNKFSL